MTFFVIALFVTMVLIPPLMASAGRLHVLDVPGERKVHTAPIPRVGGIAMVTGTALPTMLWLHADALVTAYMLGAAILLGFGVWDDRRQISARWKFLGQVLAALLVVFYGGVRIEYMPFTDPGGWPAWIGIPFTVFALVGITNAINLADGLDGLAGGCTLLSATAIAVLGFQAGDNTLVLIALAVAGSVLGFLRYNTYPARVFMGDAGSQFLGFSLGVLTIVLTQRSNTTLSPSIALLLLGLPVIDTVLVMSQRVREHRSPFSPDNNHIHHRLLAIGLDHYEAVFTIYFVQATLVTGAYLLRFQADGLILALYVGLFFTTGAVFRRAAATGWRLRGHGETSFVRSRVQRVRESDLIGRAATATVAAGVAACLAVAAWSAAAMPRDIWYLAAAMLVFTAGCGWLRRGRDINLAERMVVYVTGSVVVYLVQIVSALPVAVMLPLNVGFVIIVLAIATAFRFSRDRSFVVTPLDFLVIFIALVLPNLPGLRAEDPWFSDTMTKMIIMFYACEFLASRYARHGDVLRYTLGATLGILLAAGALA